MIVVLAAALGGPAAAQQEAAVEPEAVEPYVLNPGDVLEISVLEDSSLNREVLVRPDGMITVPLAGTVQAAGRTPEALQEILRARLAEDFIEPPTVTVSLASTGEAEEEDALFIYVIGQVASPGRHEILEPVGVLQALAIAGGPTPFAASSRIQIRRRDENGGETVRLFDYETIEEGAGHELLLVGHGDVVVVPERGLFE